LFNIKTLNIVKEPKEIKDTPDILVQDVIQGDIGDCYFLSIMSALAENPQRIKNLMMTSTLNNQGVYEIKLFIHGEPVKILVDDYVVVKEVNGEKKLAFTRINENSRNIWPILMEKVWAKLNISYENIIAGTCAEAFQILTPSPFNTLFHNIHQECLFEDIAEANDKGFIICCDATLPGNNKGINTLTDIGLITNHAYTVLETYKLADIKGTPIKLLKIRNPWGSNEWEGDWSDTSHKWTPEISKLVNHVVADDGIFFMCIEDYIKYYTTTHIFKYHDNYYFNSFKFKFNHDHPTNFVKAIVPRDTEGYFLLNQSNARIYKNTKGLKNYENHFGSLIVFKKESNGKIIALGGDCGSSNRLHVDCPKLTKGEYYIAVGFPHPHDQEELEDHEEKVGGEEFFYRIGVYCNIDDILLEESHNHEQLFSFMHYYAHDLADKNESVKQYYLEENEKDSWRGCSFKQSGGAYGYIVYDNKTEGYINERIIFNELYGVNIIPLLNKGEIKSLDKMVENSEEPMERNQLKLLKKTLEVEGKYEVISEPKGKITKRNPLIANITVPPYSTACILLEKYTLDSGIDFQNEVVFTYPIHSILCEKKFVGSKSRIKYNNKLVEIYETLIEYPNGAIFKINNKTTSLDIACFIKFNDIKNLKITLSSDELLSDFEKFNNDEIEEEDKLEVIQTDNLIKDTVNLVITNPETERILYVNAKEVKFIQLSAIDIYEPFSFSYDSKYHVMLNGQI